MQATGLLVERVNLRQYPEKITYKREQVVTIGDLHGHVMKLLWVLIREGAITMEPATFAAMWEAYDRISSSPTIVAKEPLKLFLAALAKITVNRGISIQLLGDIFADRGGNDYLTLKVFEWLHLGGMCPKIIFSNHDAFLFNNYWKTVAPRKFVWIKTEGGAVSITDLNTREQLDAEWSFDIREDQQNSMLSLFSYIKIGIVSQEEVAGLLQQYIFPTVSLISYTLTADGESVDIFMHAPNNFNVIQGLAEGLLGIPKFNPKTAIEIAATIDRINERFSLLLAQEEVAGISLRKILQAINEPNGAASLNQGERALCLSIFPCIWNRLEQTGGCINFSTYPRCVAHVIHGHTMVEGSANRRQINLDGILGKVCRPLLERGYQPEVGEYLTFSSSKIDLSLARANRLQMAKDWIVAVEHLAEVKKTHRAEIGLVALAARALLNGYVNQYKGVDQYRLLNEFKTAVDNVQRLHIKNLSWVNVLHIFIPLVPGLINLYKTGGKFFWVREFQNIDKEKFEGLVRPGPES